MTLAVISQFSVFSVDLIMDADIKTYWTDPFENILFSDTLQIFAVVS